MKVGDEYIVIPAKLFNETLIVSTIVYSYETWQIYTSTSTYK